jgi:hypothetical protein
MFAARHTVAKFTERASRPCTTQANSQIGTTFASIATELNSTLAAFFDNAQTPPSLSQLVQALLRKVSAIRTSGAYPVCGGPMQVKALSRTGMQCKRWSILSSRAL